jgi:NAD(P)-dependent dehydrogenase (short-subunit alcohol dehydrogenase family)
MEFNGKVVVVTGAGQGLGAGCAKEFAEQGAHVVLVGRTASKLEVITKEIRETGGKAIAYRCDVGDHEDVAKVFADIQKDLGKVDVLVNNAAVHKSMPVQDTSVEDWDMIIRINLSGTFYCIKAVLPGMIERQFGKIINISSNSAKFFYPGFGAYASSKGGQVSLTRILSEEVKQHNINVNAVYLGMTNTEKTRERIMEDDPAIQWKFEDMLQVDDAARVVAFLASEAAKPIMGAAVDVDGPIH